MSANHTHIVALAAQGQVAAHLLANTLRDVCRGELNQLAASAASMDARSQAENVRRIVDLLVDATRRT